MSTTKNTKESASDRRKVTEVNLDLHKGMESPEMENIQLNIKYLFYYLILIIFTFQSLYKITDCLKQKIKMNFWFIAHIEYITTVAQKPRVLISYVK